MNVAQSLGYGPQDRLLIVNADDFGLCHSTNSGIQSLLQDGVVSSATMMMPCAWARESRALERASYAFGCRGAFYVYE